MASGEYDPDMTKLAKAAMKKYEKTHRIRDGTNVKNSGECLKYFFESVCVRYGSI